jgi:hypothetical protein
MRKTIIAATLLLATPAAAEMSSAEFFARDAQRNWTGPLVNDLRSPYGTLPRTYVPANREYVARIVERESRARLGSQWTSTAMKLTKIESGFKCHAQGPRVRSHGGDRAQGAMQVMPRTAKAMGLDPRRLTECEYGIRAGIEYMRRCLETGVTNHAQMSSCYISGWGWRKVKLHARAEKYRREYIRMAMR